MKNLLTVILFCTSTYLFGQKELALVPMPAEILKVGNIVSFKLPLQIVHDGTINTLTNAKYIQKELQKLKYPSIVVSKEKYNLSKPQLMLINIKEIKDNEEYVLNISNDNLIAISGSRKGQFIALQSLLQIIKQNNKKISSNNLKLPSCLIKDYPRFAYRGMHLDVSRHFFTVEEVKKIIDNLAAYKYNTFHWHLTDDQGWRIEIKKYPLLTTVGGYRNGTLVGRYPGKGNTEKKYGGFYTQQQIKEVVKYATERHIDVIPEIEMPGHASAAIAAYPQLSCFPNEDTKVAKGTAWFGATKGKQVQQAWGVFEDVFAPSPYTFNFLQNVIDEILPLFPSKYIHIGGDECPKENWKRSNFCQQLIKENNLKDEHGLQSYFISKIENYINKKGKKIIGWDEILEGGLAPNATVMSWRGEEGGIEAAKQNHDVIMTPGSHCYLDHSQSKNEDSVTIGGYTPLDKVYNYEPVPHHLSPSQALHILGAQANVWTEYITNNSKLEYMINPRMMAMSEVLWSPKEKRNWEDFERRLPYIFNKLDEEKTNYSKAYYDLKTTIITTEDNEGVLWKIDYKGKNNITVNFNNTDSNWIYTKPQLINADIFLAKATNGIATLTQKFSFNKATGKKIILANLPSNAYPGDGAFTLVNGVQNEKGLGKSSEFLGFSGNDLDAVIDLGSITQVNKIILHYFEQNASWIYAPANVTVHYMYNDGTSEIAPLGPATKIESKDVIANDNGTSKIEITSPQSCRYIRVVAKNYGKIPDGKPGAGEKAWLFVDEIEVK